MSDKIEHDWFYGVFSTPITAMCVNCALMVVETGNQPPVYIEGWQGMGNAPTRLKPRPCIHPNKLKINENTI